MRYDDPTSLRYPLRIGFVFVAAIAIVLEASCGDDGASRDLGPGSEGSEVPIHAEEQAPDAQSGAPMSTMRIAHLAPEIGPIDFCYQGPTSGTFIGPVLGAPASPRADAGDAGGEDEAGIPLDPYDGSTLEEDASISDSGGTHVRSASYRTVSKYFNLQAAGPLTIAIVEAGATSCAKALATAGVTLDPGKLSTVAVFGRHADGGVALEVVAFTDDRSTQPDKLRVRIVHAALGTTTVPGAGAIAVRATGAKTNVLADRVEPRRASTPSQPVGVDGLGYVTAPPMSPPVSLTIGPASTGGVADAGFDPWQSEARDLDLRGGSLHTGFVLSGASESTFEVLWCSDLTTDGDAMKCELVP